MRLNVKDIKDMTREEIEDYINFIKNNQILNTIVTLNYGSLNNFRKIINNELINIENEKKIKEELEETKNTKDYCTVIKESNINNEARRLRDNKELYKNNIEKKCKVYNDPYMRDGVEGIIKDVVKLSGQYIVVTGLSNINYVNIENVKVIEEHTDLQFKGNDEELGQYEIVFSKQNIIVKVFNNDNSIKDTYKLNFSKNEYEKLINNIEEKKDIVIYYVLSLTKKQKMNKEYNDFMGRMDKDLNFLLKGLV